MRSEQQRKSSKHVRLTLVLWLLGSALLLTLLWMGPGVLAAGLGTCGQSDSGTAIIPGPCGVDDAAGTTHGTPVTIPVLANDLDRSNTGLQVTAVTTPLRGSAAINPGVAAAAIDLGAAVSSTVTYTPDTGFSGTDTFTYTVQDGLGITATARVAVLVAAPGVPAAVVQPINPAADTTAVFAAGMRMADGSTAPMTTTVQVPAGAFTYTLGPADTLALVLRPVITPTGNITTPPASAQPLSWTGLTFVLEALLNNVRMGSFTLAEPMTLTVAYPPALLAEFDPETLVPYYRSGAAWSANGLDVISRDVDNNRIIFTANRVGREFSFFASGPALYMPQIQLRHQPN